MNALRLILEPTPRGWAVYMADGWELGRLPGPGSQRRALRCSAGMRSPSEYNHKH
jgi:hypothetical protein